MISCKEGDLTGGVSKASPGEKVEEVKVEPEITVPLAETPVVINGASLTCIANVTQGIDCEIKKNGVLTDISATAYIIRSPDLLWTETTYQVTAVGKIHVEPLLNNSISYGVGLRTAGNEVVATWVVPPTESGLDLVTNGSFENYVPGAQNTSFYSTFAEGDWQASLNPDPSKTPCPVPYLEIKTADGSGLVASEGRFVMDTNSSCVLTNNSASNPVKIWQQLKAKQGHLYELFVDARKNPGTTTNTLEINYAGQKVEWATIPTNTWIHLRYQIASSSEGGELAFLDREPNTDGTGMLIDNVRFYDLGMPPL